MASTEVTTTEAAALEALQSQYAGAQSDSVARVPILKIAQPLTKGLRDLDANPGDFIDTLMEESLGNAVSFVPAFYQRGRFYGPKGAGRVWATMDYDTIPENWVDAPGIGDKLVGTPFAEHPDAEERFKEAVNAKDREWGSGPPIQTTHNFTGLVLVEDEDDEVIFRPVRLSLRSAQTKPADRLRQLMQMSKAPWDRVLDLSTKETEFKQGQAWILNVRPGRKTEAGERSAALQLASQVMQGAVADNAAEEGTAAAAPVKTEGLSL